MEVGPRSKKKKKKKIVQGRRVRAWKRRAEQHFLDMISMSKHPHPPSTVLVTGGTGFIGSQVVAHFIKSGFRVNATTRRFGDDRKMAPLRNICEAYGERLRVFECDLLRVDSFDEAMRGCVGIVHTATPVLFGEAYADMEEDEAEKRLLRPAVDGTRDLLHLAHKHGVRFCVLTCSAGCIKGRQEIDEAKEAQILSTDMWSDQRYCRATKQWYRLAKTQQELVAMDVCRRLGIKLQRILPDLVLGESLTSHTDYGHSVVLRLLTAGGMIPDKVCGYVDVCDVAQCHVLALQELMNGSQGPAFSPLW